MGKNYVENSLKRFLKRKVKITMGVVVSFLITGMVSFGAADKTVEITLGNGKIEISQEIGALEGSTWTNDDIINVKDGNGVQITGENGKLNIVNNGIISGNISNGEVLGNGIITGVINKNENIQIIPTNLGTINNIGIILGNGAGGFSGNGIFIYSEDVNNTDEGIKNEINNIGIISGNGTEGSFSGNGITHYVAMIKAIVNTGIISGNGTGEGSGNGVLSNGGIISGNGTGEGSGNGVLSNGTVDKTKTEIKIKNIGIILGKNSNKGYGIYDVDTGADDEKKISNITNYGIIAGSSKATEGINDDKIINKGLLINGAGTDNILVKAGEGGKLADKFIINTIEKNNAFEKLENEEALTSKKIAEKLGKADTETTFENLILNGYGTALKVDGKLSLNSSIINGGVDGKSSAVKGNGNNDTFTLSGESVINGKVDLGAGNDNLTIDNTVQINGDLDGGIGGEIEGDTLTFNNSSNENMNVLHNISNFENINVDSNITLFENIKISGAEKITI